MTGYTRQSAASILPGQEIKAEHLNAEFNLLQTAFGVTGHTHDGTAGNSTKINLTTSITGVLPVANGGFAGIHKVNATGAPTVNDDSADGYAVGSHWIDVTNDDVYITSDVTLGAAVWNAMLDAEDIGTSVQAYDADLTAIAALTSAANKLPYATGAGTWALTDFSAFGRTLVDDADAATARSTLGLGTIATQAASSVTITGGSVTDITDLAVADGGTGASDASGARTNLGLGTIATQNSNNVTITGGSISGVTISSVATTATQSVQATTSGTAINFTSIPSYVRQITICFNEVSTNGTDNLFVQIGDSGGIEDTSYTSFSSRLSGSVSSIGSDSGSSFVIFNNAVLNKFSGALTLTLLDSSTNRWVIAGVLSVSSSNCTVSVGGSKALSATLDRIRITTTNGVDTFDNGSMNIVYI